VVKTVVLNLLLLVTPLIVLGQVEQPVWMGASTREATFPLNTFFTGLTQGDAHVGENINDAKQRLSKDAQGLLVESIRMRVESNTLSQTTSTQINQTEHLTAEFTANVQTTAEAEIVGVRTETFLDQRTGRIHAFAYVNRFELTGFYTANLSMNLTQIEGLLNIAQNLETDGEKAKARQQLEAASPLLVSVRYAQNLLVAIDQNSSPESLQLPKTEQLLKMLIQVQARLAQAVYVYVKSEETNFLQSTEVIANQLKSILATMGCSFVDDSARADFRLKISAKTRRHGVQHGLTVCYADVAVSLFDVRRNRTVFQDEFSQKGVHASAEAAGRKALEGAAPQIASRISAWIEN